MSGGRVFLETNTTPIIKIYEMLYIQKQQKQTSRVDFLMWLDISYPWRDVELKHIAIIFVGDYAQKIE